MRVFDGRTSNHDKHYRNTKKKCSSEKEKISYAGYPTEFAGLTQNNGKINWNTKSTNQNKTNPQIFFYFFNKQQSKTSGPKIIKQA
jgi:hypothetical protein